MINNQDLLERIEDAERIVPYCEQCGQPTTIAERDHALWLECTSLASRGSRLQSLLRLDFASLHTRQPVAELNAPELTLAA